MAENECMVSIICMAYNHAEYIRSALDSFVSQNAPFRFEVVINDDASPDPTADIIREYERKYPDIIRPVYQSENQFSKGVNIENDILIPKARGKYIAFCEGDDYWTDADKLRLQVEWLEAHPDYSACVHNSVVHYCDGSVPDRLQEPSRGDHDVDFAVILRGMAHAYHPSSLMFRRSLALDMPDYFTLAAQYGFDDYPMALHLALCGRIRYLDRPMSFYRARSNPSSWSSNVDGSYDKLRRFIVGQIEVLRTLEAHVAGEKLDLVKHERLEREFELMYIEGRDAEQRRPPYRDILKAKPFSYRLNNFLKCTMPHLHRLYRKMRGYGE